MGKTTWFPTCERPAGLVEPLRAGRDVPHSVVRGRKWRRVGPALYVPASVDCGVVEQRILEQAARLPASGAVTGWASLRWQGARFFDGLTDGGRTTLPVPLLLGIGNIRADPRVQISKEALPPGERTVVAGMSCTIPVRAVFDELRRTRNLWSSVAAVDMAAAAHLVTVEGMREYVATRQAWLGVPHARTVLIHASNDSRSPQETRLRLTWVLEAGLPVPLCNQPIFSLSGSFIGMPDLFDPVAGVVGEYDGGHHLEDDQRRADREREELFRDHGLEYFAVVRGDFGRAARVVHRMRAARRRALWLPLDQRAWTLDQPDWWARRFVA